MCFHSTLSPNSRVKLRTIHYNRNTKPKFTSQASNNPLQSTSYNGLLLKVYHTTWAYTTKFEEIQLYLKWVLQNPTSPKWNLPNNLLKETSNTFEPLVSIGFHRHGRQRKNSSQPSPYLSPLCRCIIFYWCLFLFLFFN